MEQSTMLRHNCVHIRCDNHIYMIFVNFVGKLYESESLAEGTIFEHNGIPAKCNLMKINK